MVFGTEERLRKNQFDVNDRLPSMRSLRGEQPIQLSSLDIMVTVTGQFAQTTQTMCFHNPNTRILEGELTFPLPDNSVVCGYALDIDGRMADGVIVAKKKARQILEAEIRKGIDPGLVEQTQGNVYRTRVYPIPAKGTRTVSITYTSDLALSGNEADYHLPLQHAEQLEEVSLRIEVRQTPVQPIITGGQGNMTLTDWQNMWVAEARLTRGVPTEDLLIRLPDLPDQLTMVETTQDNETFFCVSELIKKQVTDQTWKADKIAIAWDASGSRTDIEQDLEFLKALFGRWRNLIVDIQVFSNRINTTFSSFLIENGQAEELYRYLRQLPYDGATNFSSLDLTSTAEDTDAWFLFSDGLATVNERIPKIGGAKVFTLTSQVRNNSAFMQYLADQTGGKYINLLQTDAEKACEAVITHQDIPTIVAMAGCADLSSSLYGDRMMIVGRLVGESGSVTLSTGGKPIEIDADKASRGEVIARQWAGRHIHFLAITKGNQAEEILTLARKHGVVSPGSSLLVLENIEQYLEYGIEPPASRPALLVEYRERHQEMEKEIEDFSRQHLETVVSLWRKRIEWWEKEYKPTPPKPAPRRRPGRVQRSISERRFSTDIDADMVADGAFYSRSYSSDVLESLGSPSSPANIDEGSAGEWDFVPQPQRSETRLKAWSPDTPYLERIKANPGDGYSEYLRQRTEYAASPAFFFDCGAYFISLNQRDIGLRVLSNLLEMDLEDVSLMRMFAWRLQQAGELDQAIEVFERVLALRDDEPQSYRDLALALGDRWERAADREDILRAMELLYAVVKKGWERFPEIELIALMELNRLIRLAEKDSVSIPGYIDPRLIRVLDLDIRISISWDADLTDIDLHVFEPTGEHANYAHQLTAIGGLVSRDFTRGYGPEEYVLRRAVPGAYKIKAHYFGSHQQRICGPCTITVNVFTNFCRPDEQRQVMTLRLEESSADYLVGEVVIQGGSQPSSQKNLSLPDTLHQLRKGMSVVQITKMIGQPDCVKTIELDSKAIVLIYCLPDRSELKIALGPELLWARLAMSGAEVELVA
jgi:tetratricopeptide (TPR) repeat protein